jgi:putative transposase
MRARAAMGIHQAFTSYSNPKGNADMEHFLRTLKAGLVWLRDWTSPAAFFEASTSGSPTTTPASRP